MKKHSEAENNNHEKSRIYLWQKAVPDIKIEINKLSFTCIKTVTGPALSTSII